MVRVELTTACPVRAALRGAADTDELGAEFLLDCSRHGGSCVLRYLPDTVRQIEELTPYDQMGTGELVGFCRGLAIAKHTSGFFKRKQVVTVGIKGETRKK